MAAGTLLQYVLKYFLLEIERTVVTRTGVNTYLSYISSFGKILIPQRNFVCTFTDQLGM